jgi:hypothetical protein
VAQDGIAVLVEHGDLVISQENFLAPFVVEQDHIVGAVLFVIHDDIGTPLPKGLDDFRRLRPSAPAGRAAEATGGSTLGASDLL